MAEDLTKQFADIMDRNNEVLEAIAARKGKAYADSCSVYMFSLKMAGAHGLPFDMYQGYAVMLATSMGLTHTPGMYSEFMQNCDLLHKAQKVTR